VIPAQKAGQLGQCDVLLRLDRAEDHLPELLDALRARTSPPMGSGADRPSSRQARSQRIAVARPIPNRSAAERRDMPPSTATITRDRKSCERAPAMRSWLLPSLHGESHRTTPQEEITSRPGEKTL
jgi:hypothetical protein